VAWRRSLAMNCLDQADGDVVDAFVVVAVGRVVAFVT
jgi:hypothetical protein